MGNWNFRTSKPTAQDFTLPLKEPSAVQDLIQFVDKLLGQIGLVVRFTTVCEQPPFSTAVQYWWLDCRMWICPGFTYEFRQVPAPAVLKAVAAVWVGRRWHISHLHMTRYHFEKACTAISTNIVVYSVRPCFQLEQSKQTALAPSVQEAGGLCNMASVIQEGCVLQYTVCGNCYFILK